MFKAQILLNRKLINVKKQEALYKKRTKKVNELLTIDYNWKQIMKKETTDFILGAMSLFGLVTIFYYTLLIFG